MFKFWLPVPVVGFFTYKCFKSSFSPTIASAMIEESHSLCMLKQTPSVVQNNLCVSTKPRLKFWTKARCQPVFPFSLTEIHDVVEQAKKEINKGNLLPQIEESLREAIKSAITLRNRKEVVNAQSVLAEFYTMNHEPDKAEVIYMFVIENLQLMKVPSTDLSIIEASIQLADINGLNNKDEKTCQGFEWCIMSLRKLAQNEDKEPSWYCGDSYGKEFMEQKVYSLLSLALALYGKYLHRKGTNPQALAASTEAMHYASLANNQNHSSIMILYNDIATMKCDLGMFNEALLDASKAVEMSQNLENVSRADKATFYSNLACIYQALRVFSKANESFDCAWEEVSRCKDPRLKANIASLISRFKQRVEDRKWWKLW